VSEYPSDGRDSVELTFFEIPSPESRAQRLASLGLQHARDGRYEDAARAFEQVVEAVPDDPRYRANLAAAYQDLIHSGTVSDMERAGSLLESACEHLLDALRIDPDFAPAYRTLGFLYRDMEAPWRAREMWSYYLAMEPTGPLAVEVQSALDELDRQQHLHRLCEEASYLVNHGEAAAGLHLLEEVTREEPEWYEAWFWTGLACRELGLLDQGIEAFGHAVELDPESPFAHHELAALLARKGEREAAEGFWRRALDLDYEEPWMLGQLALLLWREERRAETDALLTRALDIDPANRQLRLHLRGLRAGEAPPPYEA
jgi:tetratricopeptide (TPR) repeat protein